MAEFSKASPTSLAPPVRQIRPPVDLDRPPGIDPAVELHPEDGDELGAGPRGGPEAGGQRQEKMLRPASSSNSSAISFDFLYPSARPPAGPGPGSGPALLMTLKGLLKHISPSVTSPNRDRDLLVTSLAEESRNQTQIPLSSNPLIHQDQTLWKLSSQVRPTLPGPSPLSIHTDLLRSCPPGPLWSLCASSQLTPPPTIQAGRTQKVAFFSSPSTSSSAMTTSGAPSQHSLTSFLKEKAMLSVVKIPSSSFHPPSPVTPLRLSPPPSLPHFLSASRPSHLPASSSSSFPLSSPSAPSLPPPPSSHPASVSPPRHLPSPPFFPPPLTPPPPTPLFSLFLPLSPPSFPPFLPPPSSWPPSPLPTPAFPAGDRNQEPLSLIKDQTEPKTGPSADPHPGSLDSVVPRPLPPSYLQAPPTTIIHSASDGQTVEGAWLQSKDVGVSTASLSVSLITTLSLSPAPKSGPSKGALSAPLSLGGHTHLADNFPPPLPRPRPLHCLLSTWLCGRSSANRTSLCRPPP